MVERDGMRAHYLPGHVLDAPVEPHELTRCHARVDRLPAGAMRQDWRCPWQADSTCKDCVAGLEADEAEER